ncbi:MAG: hypothetical protein AB7D57_07640 [Desulfovibrionaceae bacterium]
MALVPVLALILAAFLTLGPAAPARATEPAKGLSAEAEGVLTWLLAAAADPNAEVDPARILPLLDFVADNTLDPLKTALAKQGGSSGIGRQFEVSGSLATLLRYFFNPDIPSQLVLPSLVRGGGHLGGELATLTPPLWDRLGASDPEVFRGKEYEVCAPSEESGAWYAYDLDRLVVVMRHRGCPVVVSVSRQTGDSSVGKKGTVVDPANWVYFYSDETGVNRTGLGWADTHIYNTASVNIYQGTPDGLRTEVSHFKWLSAGWGGVNVVGKKDLLPGTEAFARGLQRVCAGPWPSAEQLEAIMAGLKGLPSPQLEQRVAQYARSFEQLAEATPDMEDFLDEVRDGRYAEIISPRDQLGTLALEQLKCTLGKNALVDLCAPTTTAMSQGPEAESQAR